MGVSSENLESIQNRPFLRRLTAYAKLTGPGWLQSAVTLGGGSLAGALYLGVVAGYSLMWLQPLAMLCGVIMLGALSHVTLERGDYPFESVKKTISPTLAWGWLAATVIADVIFCAAQASLGVATLQQNLGLVNVNPYVITTVLAACALAAASLYALGSKAVENVEFVLKILVAMVVVSFALAAGFLLFTGKVDILAVIKGFIPNPTSLFKPAASIEPMIEATGASSEYWSTYIADNQRNRIIAAFGTAVGINMTFILPYTLLKRGWTKKHRQLSRYDLAIGLLIPFSVATALLVISSAAAFHTNHTNVLGENGKPVPALAGGYYKILESKLAADGIALPEETEARRAIADTLPESDRQLAAALTNRDSKQLSATLAPLMGESAANLIFGVGVLAMVVSTMMVHMMINGFAVSQAVGTPGKARPFIIGACMPALLATFAPIAWSSDAKTALLIPTAVIATVFLPIAYLSILLLMNSKTQLGEKRASPLINILMILSAGMATFASVWTLSARGIWGTVGITGLVILAVVGIGGFIKNSKAKA